MSRSDREPAEGFHLTIVTAVRTVAEAVAATAPLQLVNSHLESNFATHRTYETTSARSPANSPPTRYTKNIGIAYTAGAAAVAMIGGGTMPTTSS